MTFKIILLALCWLGFTSLQVHAQSSCTTVQPVFEPPLNNTSTAFGSTSTLTSPVPCSACSLEVSTFRPIVSTPVSSPTTTITQAVTSSTTYVCQPSTVPITTTTSIVTPSAPIPTATPFPPVSATIQTFINELATTILYAELLANGGDTPKLCSVINPASLDGITSPAINGSAVQTEICAGASIDIYYPSLYPFVVSGNQQGVSYLFTALYAIQVAGGFPNDLQTLCNSIEATLINNLFMGAVPNVGTAVEDCVYSTASASSTPKPTATPSRNSTTT